MEQPAQNAKPMPPGKDAGGKPMPPPDKAAGGMPGEESLSDDEMAQLERFHDNIMRGIAGGEGEISKYTQGLLNQTANSAPEQIATAAAEITGSALRGNLHKNVEISPSVVIVGAALVVDELAEVKAEMGDPLSDDQTAQALMAMWPMLLENTKDLGFWSEEEMNAMMQEVSQDPDQLNKDLHDIDPTGAGALERIPAETLAGVDEEQMQGEAGGAPPMPPAPAGGPPMPPTAGGMA